jgi:hypothetical protein
VRDEAETGGTSVDTVDTVDIEDTEETDDVGDRGGVEEASMDGILCLHTNVLL